MRQARALPRRVGTALAATRWPALSVALLLSLSGCGTSPVASPTQAAAPEGPASSTAPRPPERDSRTGASGDVVGRNERLLVYVPASGDNLQAVAERFLGQAGQAWQIAEANGLTATGAAQSQLRAGAPLIVPLRPVNPGGVVTDGYQTIPILCYHRFGSGPSKMIVSPSRFEAQLEWLARNDYHVLRLSDLEAYLEGRQALPQRSVVITIDDGYESVHRFAFPALKKFGFSATLFVYTDFIGARDGLSWAQLQEMAASGVIDVQAHSKSHRNLVERGTSETDPVYRKSIETEVQQPRTVLERRLGAAGVKVRHFAYPFGDANDLVLDAMQRHGYELGVTVNPGGNPFFADPMMLRRTMIFGDHDLDDFKSRLQTRKNGSSKP